VSAWGENQLEISELKTEITRLKTLITELCYALAGMKPISSNSPVTSEMEKEKLIHRAREATK
jgi:hypothetical protein